MSNISLSRVLFLPPRPVSINQINSAIDSSPCPSYHRHMVSINNNLSFAPMALSNLLAGALPRKRYIAVRYMSKIVGNPIVLTPRRVSPPCLRPDKVAHTHTHIQFHRLRVWTNKLCDNPASDNNLVAPKVFKFQCRLSGVSKTIGMNVSMQSVRLAFGTCSATEAN